MSDENIIKYKMMMDGELERQEIANLEDFDELVNESADKCFKTTYSRRVDQITKKKCRAFMVQ